MVHNGDMPVVLIEVLRENSKDNEKDQLELGDDASYMFQSVKLDRETRRYMTLRLK